jgi:hypothetical protein
VAFGGAGVGVLVGAVVLVGGAVVLAGVGAVFSGARGAGCSSAVGVVYSGVARSGTTWASGCFEAFSLLVPALLWLAPALSSVLALLVSAPVFGASC